MKKPEIRARIKMIQAIYGLSVNELAENVKLTKTEVANMMNERNRARYINNIPVIRQVYPEFFKDNVVISFDQDNIFINDLTVEEARKQRLLNFPEKTDSQKIDEILSMLTYDRLVDEKIKAGNRMIANSKISK